MKKLLPSAAEVSLVVPCFNEEAGIAATVNRIQSYFESHFPEVHYELVLVDDGSQDGTYGVLQGLAQGHPEITISSFPKNRGRGAALKRGFALTGGDIVIALDADLSYDVDHIGEILRAFRTGNKVDVAVVSPYMKGGEVQGVPLNRLLLSRFANWLLAGFFSGKLSTVTCVVRGYRGDLIRSLPLFEDGKELHLEILRKLSVCGANIVEIPGRLKWKEQKERAKRLDKKRVFGAANRHFQYASMIRPTRAFKYVSGILVFLGIYEVAAIAYSFFQFYLPHPDSFWTGVWLGLSKSFAHSPHSFFLAGLFLVLGVQTFSFLALLQIMKLQQEEVVRHLIAVLRHDPEEG